MVRSRILVVEDHRWFRQFICSTLQRRAEFQVIGKASDGLDAIRQAECLQPDLLLLDIGLPMLNGIEVAKRIRKLVPRARILFLSLESSSAVVQECLRSGGLGYVQKLHAERDLLPAIKAVLSGIKFVSDGVKDVTIAKGDVADPLFRHEVQFYSNDSILLERLTCFIATALRAGNPAVVLATKPHRDDLAKRLKAEALDIDSAIDQGTFISLDAAETLSTITVKGVPDRWVFFESLCDLVESASKTAKTDRPRVSICGECAGLLSAEGKTDAAISLEEAGNDLGKTLDVDILCAYPLVCCQNDRTFRKICAQHTVVHSH